LVLTTSFSNSETYLLTTLQAVGLLTVLLITKTTCQATFRLLTQDYLTKKHLRLNLLQHC
jgi:hypothetical protein